jgi:hypothetical protein
VIALIIKNDLLTGMTHCPELHFSLRRTGPVCLPYMKWMRPAFSSSSRALCSSPPGMFALM